MTNQEFWAKTQSLCAEARKAGQAEFLRTQEIMDELAATNNKLLAHVGSKLRSKIEHINRPHWFFRLIRWCCRARKDQIA